MFYKALKSMHFSGKYGYLLIFPPFYLVTDVGVQFENRRLAYKPTAIGPPVQTLFSKIRLRNPSY